jgi:hypothetical protein
MYILLVYKEFSMFSIFGKKACNRVALIAVPFFLAGLLFASCKQPTGDTGGSKPANAQQPIITIQPAGGNWNVGTTETFGLTVTAGVTEGGTLSYQWYSTDSSTDSTDGSIMSGKTAATLTLNKTDYTTADKNGNHYFYVIVTNTNKNATKTKIASATSNVVTVVVNGAGGVYLVNAQVPVIDTEPEGGTFNVGTANTFGLTVAASRSDGGTLSYQWYLNTSNSTTGGTAEGTNSATLTLNKTDYTANGTFYFYVIVTNSITDNGDGGIKTESTTSTVATVTVTGNTTTPPVFTVPEDLKGEWDPKASGEELIISNTNFSYIIDSYGTESGYAGTIVNHRADGDGAGYITIEYTWNAAYEEAPGYFYVIHYKNLTSTTVSISGANNADAPEFDMSDPNATGGKATRQAAEAAYTVAGEYFAGYSNFTKGARLTNGVWKDGELTADINTVTYVFKVTAGITYYVWWNDRYEGATPKNKTADIEVWARYSDETDIFEEDIFEPGYIDSGWINPPFFTADRDDTVSVVVQASHTASQEQYKTGTFGIAYSTAGIRPGAAVAKTITQNQWEDTTIATDEIHVYTINVTQNQTYYVWWNEKGADAGDGTKTADVQVQARYSDETVIFNISALNLYKNQWADASWTPYPVYFTADRTGTVDLRVRPSYGEERYRGTYGIVYSTIATLPTKSANLISVTPNGSSGTPTTTLTLLFDKAVSLSPADITLALTGSPFTVSKGDLNGEGPSYTLGISSPINGTLTVTVGSPALFNITGSPKQVTVYGDGSNSVTTLDENLWVYDEFTATTDVHWYKFDVTTGKTYRIWWDSKDGNGSFSDTYIQERVYVNGDWVFGTATTWKDEDGWNGNYSYSPTGPGTVYVCIRPYGPYAQNLGTYGVVYSTGSTRPAVKNPNDIPVTLSNVTASGSPTTALTLTFSEVIPGLSASDITLVLNGPPFSVTKGTLSNVGPVYTLPIINSSANGTLTVTVEKPGYDITPSKEVTIYGSGGAIPVTPLVAGTWTDGNLTADSSVHWYSITVSANTTYRIWWNDRYEGPTPKTKTGDVTVTAYYADGTVIFGTTDNDGDSAWNTARAITNPGGTIYLRVRPWGDSSGNRGTYGIVFTANNDARPSL